jgi:hypothetical protein
MSPVDPTSRYAGLPELRVVQPDGTTRVFLAPRVVPAPPVSGAYVVKPGARLDLLGEAVSGDSTRWWRLADVNPWFDPTRIEQAGEIVDLPDG